MITLTKTRRIDWHELILDMRRQGMTFREIGEQVEITERTVGSYCDDRCIEPAYWTGSRLLELWSQVTGRSYIRAPTRVVLPSVAAVLSAAVS